MSDETRLEIEGVGFPKWSARGLTQSLVPIETVPLRRTINGELVDTSLVQHRKYRTEISGSDSTMPSAEHLSKGSRVRVSCLVRLWQQIHGNEVELTHLPVPGSVRVMDEEGEAVQQNVTVGDRQVTGLEGEQGKWISYRPQLDMRVISLQVHVDERQIKNTWKLVMEEI